MIALDCLPVERRTPYIRNLQSDRSRRDAEASTPLDAGRAGAWDGSVLKLTVRSLPSGVRIQLTSFKEDAGIQLDATVRSVELAKSICELVERLVTKTHPQSILIKDIAG